jgi:5-methylcytosine-specific restriction endonuclease McrA
MKQCRNGHWYEPSRRSTGAWKTCKQCMRRTYLLKKAADPKAGSLRTIAWQRANPEKYKAKQRKWCKNNKEKFLIKWHKKQHLKKRATPPWLTKEQKAEIRTLHLMAKRLGIKTGIRHSVDHIIPIDGKIVCGLHVPWNLQILTLEENSRKGNRVPDAL